MWYFCKKDFSISNYLHQWLELIHSFNKYLFAYKAPDTILGGGNTTVNKVEEKTKTKTKTQP